MTKHYFRRAAFKLPHVIVGVIWIIRLGITARNDTKEVMSQVIQASILPFA